jgi:hypothetical protein
MLTMLPSANRALINSQAPGEVPLREPPETPGEGEPSREIGGAFGVREGEASQKVEDPGYVSNLGLCSPRLPILHRVGAHAKALGDVPLQASEVDSPLA